MFHQQAERSFHHAGPQLHFESFAVIAAANDLDFQLRLDRPNTGRKSRPRIAAADLHLSQPGKPNQHRPQKALSSGVHAGVIQTFRISPSVSTNTCRSGPLFFLVPSTPLRRHDPPIRPFDFPKSLPRTRAYADLIAHVGPQAVVERLPRGGRCFPPTNCSVHCLPGSEFSGQGSTGDAATRAIENRVEHDPCARGRLAAYFGFKKHGFQKNSLGIGEIGGVV